jgi:hypothetical protein
MFIEKVESIPEYQRMQTETIPVSEDAHSSDLNTNAGVATHM